MNESNEQKIHNLIGGLKMKKRLVFLISLFFILLIVFIYLDFTDIEKMRMRFTKKYISTDVHFGHTKWLGIHVIQNPCDMWAIQEIITEVKPDFIIETGTLYGGSALFFASVLKDVNQNGKVITVDIDDKTKIQGASKFKLFQDYIEFIHGDSVSREVIDKIVSRIGDSLKVIVTLDSDHSKEHVLKEMMLYSKFVSLNSYLIVQDTHLDGWGVRKNFEGPMGALKEFLKTNKNFIPDHSREKFLFTWFPEGYLRRIR
ncbi:hypothetical protein ES703_78044 [subsurface metagenome]